MSNPPEKVSVSKLMSTVTSGGIKDTEVPGLKPAAEISVDVRSSPVLMSSRISHSPAQSPVRRSGSPVRRQRIHELETYSEKRQKITKFAATLDASGSAAAKGSSRDADDSERLTDALERISSALETTATSLRDVKDTQRVILTELASLKTAVRELQESTDKATEK